MNEKGSGSDLIIDDEGEDEGSVESFVYLRLTPGDNGNLSGRTQEPNFITRQPACVTDSSRTGLRLWVTNAGSLPSELVAVDYQIIYCTYDGHGVQDGFNPAITHAGEAENNQLDKAASATMIPGRTSIPFDIAFTEADSFLLANIYFRARVSTLWTETFPHDQWDFAKDMTVTEFTLRLAP